MRRRRVVSEHDQREWFATNVRVRRHVLGLSVRAACELVGMSQRQWQKIERNEANATVETMAKVCTALGTDILDLLSEPQRNSVL